MIGLVVRIMRFLGPYAKRIRLAWAFTFLKSLCANAPLALGVVVVNMLAQGLLEPIQCVLAALVLGILLVLQSVFQHAADRLQSTAGYELFADKRMELADHLRRLPMGYFSTGNLGKVSSVLSTDMVFVEEHSMTILADVASNVFSQAVITVFMLVLCPPVAAVVVLTELIAILIGRSMNAEALRNSFRRAEGIEDLSDSVLEHIDGLAVMKSFNMMGKGSARMRGAFSRMTETSLAFEREHIPWDRALLTAYAVGMSAACVLAVYLMQAGAVSVGVFVGIMMFAFNLFTPLRALFQLDSQITIMQAALSRIEQILSESQIAEIAPDEADCDVPGKPEVSFENVSFAYGEQEVLHDASFDVRQGQTVALVGRSGSGKTTVANLLARFWDVSSGCVRVRGRDVRRMPLAELVGNLSMVFQRVYLFDDTVFANIAMGRPEATLEEVREAARKARCLELIERLPYGFNTYIGQGGRTLSGGEAQRISIARCILKDAPIVILDEATANLDADNEAAIQAAMTELCRNKTVLVIAHRLNTVASADEIVVLEDGRVAEQGTHDELIGRDGAYARLVATFKRSGTGVCGGGES